MDKKKRKNKGEGRERLKRVTRETEKTGGGDKKKIKEKKTKKKENKKKKRKGKKKNKRGEKEEKKQGKPKKTDKGKRVPILISFSRHPRPPPRQASARDFAFGDVHHGVR